MLSLGRASEGVSLQKKDVWGATVPAVSGTLERPWGRTFGFVAPFTVRCGVVTLDHERLVYLHPPHEPPLMSRVMM